MRRAMVAMSALLLAGLLPGGAAQAQDCYAALTQQAIAECAGGDYQKLDAELNKAYRSVGARLAGNDKKKQLLTSAQRAWIEFRDNECRFAASGVEGGSVYSTAVASCAANLTAARIAALRAYLNCPEGDVACPVPAN